MVIGESLSALTDKPSEKLDFHMQGPDADEAQEYKVLVELRDTPGSIELLRDLQESKAPARRPSPKPIAKPPSMPLKPLVQPRTTGFVIEEIESGSEDDDLIPYAKPDSDTEDSDTEDVIQTKAILDDMDAPFPLVLSARLHSPPPIPVLKLCSNVLHHDIFG